MHLKHHVQSAVSVRKAIFWVLFISLSFAGCAHPSDEDKRKIRELESLYGDRYTFRFEDEFYIHAILKKGAVALDQDCEEMYILFRFSDYSKRAVTKNKLYLYEYFQPKWSIYLSIVF